MLGSDHVKIEHTPYRNGAIMLERLIVFLEKFVPANLELIQDHKLKKKKGKRTRRWQVTKTFEEVTKILEQMLRIFGSVQIRPVNAKKTFCMLDYYKNLSEFDR